MQEYLKATPCIDSDSSEVITFAREVAGAAGSDADKAVKLYYAVRDRIRYDPYSIVLEEDCFKASQVLRDGWAFCIPKAILLTAAARALGIPAAVGFADVRNHLATEKLLRVMGSDLFVYHGYTALWLDGAWVKATPAFNIQLCQRFGVVALDFDGVHDALLHPYDSHNRRHMEYVQDHGLFADFPAERIFTAFHSNYPDLSTRLRERSQSRFEDEKTAALRRRRLMSRPLARKE